MSTINVSRKVIIPHKEAHSASVNTISFVPSTSEDENIYIATGASDDTIRVWDMQGKEIKIFIGHIAPVTQIDFAFFQDKLILASSSEDGTVKIWDYETGEVKFNFIEAANIVKTVKIKDNFCLTGSKDKHFRIYDLNTEKMIFDLELGGVTAIAAHPHELSCVVGTTTNHLIIFDIASLKVKKKILAHELPIQGLDYSSDGKLLVSASLNKQVKIWNVQNDYVELIGFNAHSSAISTIKFRPFKDSFASCGFDRNTYIFQPGNLKPFKKFKGPKLAVTDLCWDKTGEKIAISSADGSFRCFNVENENEPVLLVEVTKEYFSHLLFEPTNNSLITGYGNGNIQFFSLENYLDDKLEEKLLIADAHKGKINWLGITLDHKLLTGSEDKYLKLWDIESGELLKSSEQESSHTLGINDIIIHPTESWCISVSSDTSIKKWQLPDLLLLESYATHKYAVNSITFSTDFEYIVTTSNDKRVVLHDKNMKELFTYKGHTDSVLSSVFSQDNKYLFTGARNGKIIIFDVQKEKEINTLTLHTDEVFKFKFSDDYKFLAIISADNSCSIFSYKTIGNSFELTNIFLASFSGNPTDIAWLKHNDTNYSLLISTFIGELIEFSFKDE